MGDQAKPNKRKGLNSLLTVESVKLLSPNFMRIVFSSELVLDIDNNWIGPHVKLLFPSLNDKQISFPQVGLDNKIIWQEGVRERVRTYSVRHYQMTNNQLTIDFAIHQHGVGTIWAQNAQVGDQIGLLAMGAKNQFNPAETLILLGDIAATPAICYTLEHLPTNQSALAIIELPDEQDKQTIQSSSSCHIQWVITARNQSSKLMTTLAQQDLSIYNRLMFWGGMESSLAQPLRHYIKQHFAEQANDVKLVSYWRDGFAEGQFKHSD